MLDQIYVCRLFQHSV